MREVAFERGASGGGQAVFGMGGAVFKILAAFQIAGIIEPAGVDAEVAV